MLPTFLRTEIFLGEFSFDVTTIQIIEIKYVDLNSFFLNHYHGDGTEKIAAQIR